jgi:hypothetical protein
MQSGGLFVVLKMQQYGAKVMMHNQMSREGSAAQQLRLHGKDYINSIADSKEIFYKGELYDVLSYAMVGDSVDLSVIRDEKEGNIVKRIKNLFTQPDDGNKKTPQEVIRLLTLDYLPTSHTDISIVFNHFTINKTSFSEGVIVRNAEVFLPPPELV